MLEYKLMVIVLSIPINQLIFLVELQYLPLKAWHFIIAHGPTVSLGMWCFQVVMCSTFVDSFFSDLGPLNILVIIRFDTNYHNAIQWENQLINWINLNH